ncbi:hypothetical protein LSTR_LSTR005102 [Laodelphax striatellus]|uniref:Spaetzle domain-containing protein n=1 Tax=Laodelphax striatellus TaxID=195883 RepID=A0A482WPW2_LAOST|nr:hypothetical protein LSTR_LSTR005102 [Laodelphax striatellus]
MSGSIRLTKLQPGKVLLAILVAVVGGNGEQDSGSGGRCRGSGQQFKYMWGDALLDSPSCTGPNNMPYPSSQISRAFSKLPGVSSRTARNYSPVDPSLTQRILLKSYEMSKNEMSNSMFHSPRTARDFSGSSSSSGTNNVCQSTPSRLCKTRYNTTAPMYGVSLTSGQPVTIVQKFPDLLQQVVYEVCETNECDVVRGECTQTYVPYLFLVIPLGPVTLTGQDYVLVESGCVCKPKYASSSSPTQNDPAAIPHTNL